MPTTTYAIEDRVVLQAGLEGTYGSESGVTYEVIPIYDAAQPIEPDIGVIELNRAKDSLGADAFAPTQAKNNLRFRTYVYGSGVASVPPPWMRLLLPASGFIQSEVEDAAPSTALMTATQQVAVTAGALANGAYEYTVTKVDILTTDLRDETFAEIPSGSDLTVTVSGGPKKVDLDFLATPGAGFKWRIYRTKVGVALASGTGFYVGETTASTYTDDKPDYALDQTRTMVLAADAVTPVVYTPRNEDFDSLSMKWYLDSHLRKALGTRGSWTCSAEAGVPMQMNWDMMGLYAAAISDPNPDVSCLGPGIPPKWKNISATLIPTHADSTWLTEGTTISPLVIKSVNFTSGTQVNNRTDANATNEITELAINQKFQARLTYVIEADRATAAGVGFDWDPVEDMNLGITFGSKFTIGTATNKRIEVSWPRLQISRAPRLVTADTGITCWEIEFSPTDFDNCEDWMQWRHY